MKNKAAQALGKMGAGKPKTMTAAAIAARRAQMAKINAKKSKQSPSKTSTNQ